MKVMFFVIIALVGASFCLLMVLKHLKAEVKLLKCQLEASEKEKSAYARQVQRLTSAGEITAEVRKKADEKNAKLHSGDAVDNAIKQLSKSKN